MNAMKWAKCLCARLPRRRYLLGLAGAAGALLALPWLLNGQQPAPGEAPQSKAPDLLGDAVIKAYPLTPQAGDWLILAASYTGPYGQELASQVVRSLRRDDNMPAFIFNKGQHEKEEQEREIEAMRARDPHARVKTVKIEGQYAVMIGGFKDQNAAVAALPVVQKLPLPDVNLGPDIVPHAVMQVRNEKMHGYDQMFVNPFWTAMVVPNPTLAQKPAAKADPKLKELNEGEEYNLLKNPSPFTLYVRDYFGASMIQQGNTNSGPVTNHPSVFSNIGGVFGAGATPVQGTTRPWGIGEKPQNALDAGAKQAHETARCLREDLHYDAYVLHTQEASIVAIGGFTGPDDPRMVELANTLARDGRVAVMQLMSPPLVLRVPRP
jgi:hypothetical protein